MWQLRVSACVSTPVPDNMEADERQRRAEEAKALAVQTQDLWEREALLRVATQWQLIAAHKAAKR
jgi:hypothetical protein